MKTAEEIAVIAHRHAMEEIKPYIWMIVSPIIGTLIALAIQYMLFFIIS